MQLLSAAPLHFITFLFLLPLASPSHSTFTSRNNDNNLPVSTTYDSIRRTLSLYALAVDTRSPLLFISQVFTSNASASYDNLGSFSGAANISAGIINVLEPVITQHQLTTQIIDVHATNTDPSENGRGGGGMRTANATTYFQASHFGKGALKGEVYTVFGRYEDSLVWVGGEAEGSGSGSGWRIQSKVESDIVSFLLLPSLSCRIQPIEMATKVS